MFDITMPLAAIALRINCVFERPYTLYILGIMRKSELPHLHHLLQPFDLPVKSVPCMQL